jgi:hypothetical protein
LRDFLFDFSLNINKAKNCIGRPCFCLRGNKVPKVTRTRAGYIVVRGKRGRKLGRKEQGQHVCDALFHRRVVAFTHKDFMCPPCVLCFSIHMLKPWSNIF